MKFSGLHLRSIEISPWEGEKRGFPWSLGILREHGMINLTSPVTILCGENGSGKSSLLELVGMAAQLPGIGYHNPETDPTLSRLRLLLPYLRLGWTRRPKRGFFLRAEDFFGFSRRVEETREQLRSDLEEAKVNTAGRSITAQQYATMAFAGQLADIERRYGEGLDARSHGEGFLHLFHDRIIPGGFYLMDEPEAPLSPLRQIGLLALIEDSVKAGSQFIIATHSPILMAAPRAQILSFEDVIVERGYEELEHVQVTRDFLNHPEAYLRHVMRSADD